MKRSLLFFALIIMLIIIPSKVFSTGNESTMDLIDKLIDKKLELDTMNEVNNLAQSLTSGERLELYNKRSISSFGAAGASLLSLFVGFGTGSFVYGNTKSGWTFLILDTLSAASVAMAATNGNAELGAITIIGLYLVRIIEASTASAYREAYNTRLMKALFSDSPASFALTPAVDSNSNLKTVLSARIEF